MNEKVNVTKVFLPPMEEYTAQVQRAFDKAWLTNRGELVLELELKLKEYLGIDHLLMMNNGTIPLQILMRLLGNGGEVITTPFSYVATTAAIVWEGCDPVFVDIEPRTFTINPNLIEAAITSKTKGILATHVFGNPCDIEAIDAIAQKHGLWVVYDGAHAFGVKYKGKSLFEYGTASTCSFHATKLFHTGEGGALFTKNQELQHKIFYSHNFGHNGPDGFYGLGINGKISELQAAMGLSVFNHLELILGRRREIIDRYISRLNVDKLKIMELRVDTEWNYSYFPVLFNSEQELLKVTRCLNDLSIYPRRYFYPSLNSLPYVEYQKCQVSEFISERIMCLPLFYELKDYHIDLIAAIINREINN